MVQTVPVNKTALSSCLKAALFLRCVGIRNIQQGGYWMFKGACRLDDLAHRHIIFIFPTLVKLFFWCSLPLFNLFPFSVIHPLKIPLWHCCPEARRKTTSV